jgi:hypothetical protein
MIFFSTYFQASPRKTSLRLSATLVFTVHAGYVGHKYLSFFYLSSSSSVFSSEWRFLPHFGIGLVVFSNRTYVFCTLPNHAAMTHLLREGITSPPSSPSPSSGHENGSNAHQSGDGQRAHGEVLCTRAQQLVKCLQNNFDEDLSKDIFASNFYLDKPRRLWLEETRLMRSVLSSRSVAIGPVQAENNLRGSFTIATGTSAVMGPVQGWALGVVSRILVSS